MEQEESLKVKEPITLPSGSSIKLTEQAGVKTIIIPARGFKGKGLLTVSVILLWLFTMMAWSVLLLMMKPVYVLYSIPLWAIGLLTLFKSLKMLSLEQTLVIEGDKITMKMTRDTKGDEKEFNVKDLVVNLVEGSYYSYAGFSKRGQYPAIISNDEAFGFAERSSSEEKAWLLKYINNSLQNK